MKQSLQIVFPCCRDATFKFAPVILADDFYEYLDRSKPKNQKNDLTNVKRRSIDVFN